MAPNTITPNVEERSLSATSTDDNHAGVATHGKYLWLRRMWSKLGGLNLKIDWFRKHKKKSSTEQPKVVISKSPKSWLLPIMVHIVPILASIVIVAINLKGYFIGTKFVGVTDDEGQSTALLSLQVTAKIFEISVISSLSFIVLDVVHHFLFFDDHGLPFSLAGARLTFTDLFYLTSPAFWSGIKAFRSMSLRVIVALLIVSCGILATFIGPAAALLLIPLNDPEWPAGGLRFLLSISESEMWPLQLNGSHVGPPDCINPRDYQMDYAPPRASRCLWYSTQILSSTTLLYPHPIADGSLTIDDFGQSREISWSSFAVDYSSVETATSCTTWAWTGMSIASFASQLIYALWLLALFDNSSFLVPKPQQALSLRHARYLFRDPYGDKINLSGLRAPAARVYCLGDEQDFDVAMLYYPVIPVNGTYRVDTNATFLIPSSLASNTSIIRTFWTPKPMTPPEVRNDQEGDSSPVQLPSAFLAIQIPLESESAGIVYTCSVDARWISNTTQLMRPFSREVSYNSKSSLPTYTQIDSATFESQGQPSISGISPTVDLDVSWLEQLTPSFNETLPETNLSWISPGYTSMAKSLSSCAIRTKLMTNDTTISKARKIVEMFATVLVIDGMARVNMERSMKASIFDVDFDLEKALVKEILLDDPRTLLAGGGGTESISRNESELSYLEYVQTISIGGYAYSIDSTGDILALIVIFMYMIFAVANICFILWKRWSSVDWWSVMDMLAVSQNSPASDLLRNASGGVSSASTSRLLLKLRVPDVPLGDRESIQVLVCKDGSGPDQGLSDYHKIEKEKVYY